MSPKAGVREGIDLERDTKDGAEALPRSRGLK